jgi:hypothetical protein
LGGKHVDDSYFYDAPRSVHPACGNVAPCCPAQAIEEAFFYELQNDVDKYRTRSTGLVDVLDFENGRPKDPGSFDLVAYVRGGHGINSGAIQIKGNGSGERAVVLQWTDIRQ